MAKTAEEKAAEKAAKEAAAKAVEEKGGLSLEETVAQLVDRVKDLERKVNLLKGGNHSF